MAAGRLPAIAGNGFQQSEISWPEISEANATLRTPRSVKVGPPDWNGGSMFQRKRETRESVWEEAGPTKHVDESKQVDSPLVEKAHLPRDVCGAVRSVADNESNALKFFWGTQIEVL